MIEINNKFIKLKDDYNKRRPKNDKEKNKNYNLIYFSYIASFPITLIFIFSFLVIVFLSYFFNNLIIVSVILFVLGILSFSTWRYFVFYHGPIKNNKRRSFLKDICSSYVLNAIFILNNNRQPELKIEKNWLSSFDECIFKNIESTFNFISNYTSKITKKVNPIKDELAKKLTP